MTENERRYKQENIDEVVSKNTHNKNIEASEELLRLLKLYHGGKS